MTIRFVGPFSWPGFPDAPCVFECEEGKYSGVYLWAVARPEGYLVYYVGETGRSFAARMLEHYKEHAAGFYHVYSAAEFARGEKVAIWPGRYDPAERRSARDCVAQYDRLGLYIAELTGLYRFLLAPLASTVRVRRRIEAALASSLYAQPGAMGRFQDKGIRYAPRLADEGAMPCQVASAVPILGLPDRLCA